MIRVTFILCMTVALLLPGLTTAQWSTGGGNNARNHRAPFLGPQDDSVNWTTFDISDSWSYQFYAEGQYAMVETGCADVTTGDLLWTFAPYDDQTLLGINNGRVYLHSSPSGTILSARAVETGAPLWETSGEFTADMRDGALFVGEDDLILAGYDGYGSRLVRINGETGDIVWQSSRLFGHHPDLPAPYAGNISLNPEGSRIYAWVNADGQGEQLAAFHPGTGEELYRSPVVLGWFRPWRPPVVDVDGAVYVNLRDNDYNLKLWRVFDDGSSLTTAWMIDLEDGEGPLVGLAINGDLLCVDGGQLEIRDAFTGEMFQWGNSTTDGPTDLAVDVNGFIYLGHADLDGSAMNVLDPENYQSLWSEGLPSSQLVSLAVDGYGNLLIAGEGFVRSYQGDGLGIAPGSGQVPTESDIDLQVYPNPTNAAVNVSFTLPSRAAVTVRVVDVLGREVLVDALGSQSAGNIRTTLDAATWTSGSYWVRVQADKTTLPMTRVVVVK